MTEEKRHKTNMTLTAISVICSLLTIAVLGSTIYNNSASANQKKGVDSQRMEELEKGREENKQNIITIKGDMNKNQEEVLTAIEALKGKVENSNTKIDLMRDQINRIDTKLEGHMNATLSARPKPTG
jgi:chromosome segregation ATPase